MSFKVGSLVRLSYGNWGAWEGHLGVVLKDSTPDYSTASGRVKVIWLNSGQTDDMLVKHLEIISEG